MTNTEKIYQLLLLRAESLIQRRPKTEQQIRFYLSQKAKRYKIDSQDIIEKVISELKQLEYINDQRFIKLWVEDRSYFKPRASRVLMMELIKKGIDRQLISDYLEQHPINEKELADQLLIKKFGHIKNPDPKKMISLLFRRGFNFGIAKKAVADFIKKE